MVIQIIIFGQLAEILNSSILTLTDISDTDSLVNKLHKLYPALADRKYIMAVDKQTISGNTILKEGSIVALLPPFSGG